MSVNDIEKRNDRGYSPLPLLFSTIYLLFKKGGLVSSCQIVPVKNRLYLKKKVRRRATAQPGRG